MQGARLLQDVRSDVTPVVHASQHDQIVYQDATHLVVKTATQLPFDEVILNARNHSFVFLYMRSKPTAGLCW